MLKKIRKLQKKLNIKLSIEFYGEDIIIKKADFINIPHPIICKDYKNFKKVVHNLVAQTLSSNVIYLHEKDPEDYSHLPDAKILPFPTHKTKKESNPYAYNGYQLQESNPADLEKAVCFINNIAKPVHEQDKEYRDYFIKK